MSDRTGRQKNTGAGYLRAKAKLKRYAERIRRIRSERDRKQQCRTCGDDAVVSKRTGQLTKQCARHLGCDVHRKTPYVLPWEVDGQLEYPIEQPSSSISKRLAPIHVRSSSYLLEWIA